MGFTKKSFITLTIACICYVSGQNAFCQAPENKIFIPDNPIVAALDSLAILTFFTNEDFTTDISKLNKYNFPLDSIPMYSDSVYSTRIKNMNISSPFEFVYNDQVKTYVEAFAYKKRKLVARMLGLAELYFPLFEEQLDIHGLPLELKYLPIIESALNPIARSRAGASGLWQFMLNTGKMYDLTVTSYVDDRYDPYKSTVAACKHLKDLYNIYHDWAIVLAAYNAGSGTVNRAIRASNPDSNEVITYWKIREFLPTETQNYVPGFIAVSYIMNYTTEHNIYPVAPAYFFCQIDTITVTRNMSLSQISDYLCIPIEQLEFINPAYKKGIIPATTEKSYTLRLPRQYVADYLNNIDAICNYKTTEELQREKYMAAAANNQKTTSSAQTSQSKTTSSNTSTSKTTSYTPTNYSKYVYHTVQKGDSLWSIANKYNGATVEDIRRLNNLPKSCIIYPGMKLKIGVKG